MEVKRRKLESLSGLFLKHLVAFFVLNILVFGVLIFLSSRALSSGILLPANYAEWAIEQVKEEIAIVQEFDEALIPYTCEYVLIGNNNQILQSNVSEKKALQIVEAANQRHTISMKQYQMIERETEVCIIAYDIMMHFSNPFLHKVCPKPELLSFFVFLMIAMFVAMMFARRLKKELKPILTATKAITQQDLDFEIGVTKLKEFHTVLQSVSDMKDALQMSLKEQWTMEQHRKMQVASITHDMKTPITVVRGNTELLQESELTEEQQELVTSILLSVDKMEKYLSLLMSATKSEGEEKLQKESGELEAFVSDIEEYAKTQCLKKGIVFTTESQQEIEGYSGKFYADVTLLERAILNIIDNAVEYTPVNGTVKMCVTVLEERISFSIIDSGTGFSKESMRCATQQFYTEREERAGKHYGLGLFIAQTVAKRHGGELVLANREDGEGAVVTLIISK